MATVTVVLTRAAWVDLGPSPMVVFAKDSLEGATLVRADTAPDASVRGVTVNSTYWQGLYINGSGQRVWGRALGVDVSATIVTADTGSGVAAPGLSADKTVASGSGVKASSVVTVYKNGTQAGTTTANATGSWAYTFSSALQPNDTVTYDATYASPSTTVPTPVPAPVFTVQPTISPSSGAVGQTFTAADGTVTNGTVTTRQWALNGVALDGATGASYTSTTAGTLTCTVTATGTGGSASATTAGVTVVPSAGANPTFFATQFFPLAA